MKNTVTNILPTATPSLVRFRCPSCNLSMSRELGARGSRNDACYYCKASLFLPYDVESPLLAFASRVGSVVGSVDVIEQQFRHDNSFETASYWEDSVSAMGVFPVTLGCDAHNKERFFFTASLPAVVVESFFPSSFGGVMYGKTDTLHDTGRDARPIGICLEITADLFRYGTEHLHANGCEWSIEPEMTELVREWAQFSLGGYFDYIAFLRNGADSSQLSYALGRAAHFASIVSAIDSYAEFRARYPRK